MKIDMKGQKFGSLLVLEEAPKDPKIKSRSIKWKCLCDCGKEINVFGYNLRNGNTKSCGCLQKKITSELKSKDITNQKFGHLTALYINGKTNNNHTLWHCKCDCGKECDVSIDNLTCNKVKSCGCEWHNSYGSQKIKMLLEEMELSYKMEVKENINNQNYYWDFVINYEKPDFWIIEFDGEQHFKSGSEKGWNTKQHLLETHKRDMIKNNFAFNNNILLIRIPYNKEEFFTKEDLDPHSSKYVVNKYNINNYYKENGFIEEDEEEAS